MLLRVLFFAVGGAAAASSQAAECDDLSGVWRMADVNPSHQYIASVTPGKVYRYRLSKDETTAGSYSVSCQSGPCMKQPNSTLRAVMNGTVAMVQAASKRAESPGKCENVQGHDWFLHDAHGEHYEFVEGESTPTSSSFSVKCVPGPGSKCTSWQTAAGKLDVSTQTATVTFNDGRSQSGVLTPDCKRIYSKTNHA